ncbi:MAG TPA: hypothetical protein VFI93_03120 [Rhizomicrobium sp.]|nr:hypothetical protein [Rhizomicrobium sp.]
MSRLSYDTAEVLVYDPVTGNRTATRAALYNLGFRKIETVGALDAFASSLRRKPPDLVLCEAQGADTELCTMIQNMRQSAEGYNPFIVVIVTAWDNSNALVHRVLNSGADDLLLRPFSAAILAQRIWAHIERRKGFVITSEYVGPDRRADSARPSDVELFTPPNSLQMKAKERLTENAAMQRLDSELKTARHKLTSEKLRRDAFQVCILWRLVQDAAPKSRKYDGEMEKLKIIASNISKRCLDTDYEAAVEWCDSILSAVDNLREGEDRNAAMHLLGHAALGLNRVFDTEKSSAEHLKEIEATVAIIKARHQTAMAS